MRWKFDSGTSVVESYAVSAANSWDGIMPPWIGWQKVTDSSQHLTVIEYGNNTGACGSGIPGCFSITGWTQDLTEQVNKWQTARIKVNFSFATFSADAKKYALLHEFGHAIGLHERYTSNGCGSDTTVMDAVYLDSNNVAQPCDVLSSPSSLDQSRITTYYRQGSYTRDPNGDNTGKANGLFYSRWDDYSANEDKMRVELEYLNGSTWTYYGYFEWITYIGAHQGTGQGNDLVLSANLNSYGAPQQKWHRMCVIPVFGFDANVLQFGTKTCSTSEFWP